MPLKVALSVTFDVQAMDVSCAGDGNFPDRGADGSTAPGYVSGEADVQRD
jgi:hypothetical protein